MRHGFVKVASATPKIKVADPTYNREQVYDVIKEAAKRGSKIIVLPELVLSSYTCNDLFLQDTLLESCKEQLGILLEQTQDLDVVIFVGLPWEHLGKIYNVAAALYQGKLLALITKSFIPNYAEFYEGRYFTAGPKKATYITYQGNRVPFGANILLQNMAMKDMIIGCEICEDVWVAESPSTKHAMAGAAVIVNL